MEEATIPVTNLKCGEPFYLTIYGSINMNTTGPVEYTWYVAGKQYNAVKEIRCTPGIVESFYIKPEDYSGNGAKIPVKLHIWNRGGISAEGFYTVKCN